MILTTTGPNYVFYPDFKQASIQLTTLPRRRVTASWVTATSSRARIQPRTSRQCQVNVDFYLLTRENIKIICL